MQNKNMKAVQSFSFNFQLESNN